MLMEIVCFCSQAVNSGEKGVGVRGLPCMPQEALTEWQTVCGMPASDGAGVEGGVLLISIKC